MRQALGEENVSERRACSVLSQPRRTQRYQARPADDEPALIKRILALVGLHPRFGYRRIWALLKGEGWRVNRKRIWRLWKKEGLKVPQNKHKKRRLGEAVNGCTRLQAAGKDCIWAMDFVFDVTANGRSLKWLAIVDEYTRECLTLEVARQFKATDVLDVLRELIAIRGVPAHIRCDNGPEFIAQAVKTWLETSRSARCTSSREARGRTAMPRASTASCGTNCWRWRSSRPCRRPVPWRRGGVWSTTIAVRTAVWTTRPRRRSRRRAFRVFHSASLRSAPFQPRNARRMIQ